MNGKKQSPVDKNRRYDFLRFFCSLYGCKMEFDGHIFTILEYYRKNNIIIIFDRYNLKCNEVLKYYNSPVTGFQCS